LKYYEEEGKYWSMPKSSELFQKIHKRTFS